MTAPSATFQTKIAADQVQPIWLVSFSTYRYALYAQAVEFDSLTYTATDGMVSQIEETTERTVPSVTVTLQNIDRVIRDWLRGYDRRGTEVTIQVVFADNLGDSDGVLERLYDLDAYSWDDTTARFTLTESTILRGLRVPSGTTNPHFCRWDFKSDECGYVGTYATCNYTYADCKVRFGTAPKRFGGFLGKPRADLGYF